MTEPEETNPYQLLDISLDATDSDIKSAYRKLSLKVHPDRNRNNPDAGRKFHELTLAYELLLDPLRRTALDQTIRLKEEKKLRYQGFNKRRRDMLADLEARELEVKKARVDKEQKEKDVWSNNEKIMNEGRRLREEREKEARKREEIAAAAASSIEEPPAIGDLDTTIRLKYSLSSQPNLTTTDAIADLIRQFGEVDKDSIVLSIKAKASKTKKKPAEESAKIGTALVPLKRIGDAFAAVSASAVKERGLQDVQVSWAGEGGREPPLIGWLKRQGKLGSNANVRSPVSSPDPVKGTTFPSFPNLPSVLQPTALSIASTPGIDYESLTLMRLREAERARLEREILTQEANES